MVNVTGNGATCRLGSELCAKPVQRHSRYFPVLSSLALAVRPLDIHSAFCAVRMPLPTICTGIFQYYLPPPDLSEELISTIIFNIALRAGLKVACAPELTPQSSTPFDLFNVWQVAAVDDIRLPGQRNRECILHQYQRLQRGQPSERGHTDPDSGEHSLRLQQGGPSATDRCPS